MFGGPPNAIAHNPKITHTYRTHTPITNPLPRVTRKSCEASNLFMLPSTRNRDANASNHPPSIHARRTRGSLSRKSVFQLEPPIVQLGLMPATRQIQKNRCDDAACPQLVHNIVYH